MSNPLMTKQFVAGGTIPAGSIVRFGADDNTVVVATAATDLLIGVVESFEVLNTERADVVTSGIAEVRLGGTVARGGPVTSNATGQGVAAAPAAGVNNRLIGFALQSGVSGDFVWVQLAQGLMQG